VDYTNKWSNSMPAAIGGKWYIYYKGSYSWSHFEAPAAKSLSVNMAMQVKIYPVPFVDKFYLEFTDPAKVNRIEIYNILGVLIKSINRNQITDALISIDAPEAGKLFLVRIITDEGVIERKVIR
ncbi:MAG: T9SS type A sorting domain-containing protein, partial [Bacteroidales bacterium]